MARHVIVTGGDARYFPLLEDLAASIRDQAAGAALGLSVIDTGLTREQGEHLARRYGARILQTGWEFPEAERRHERPSDKLSVARAFLDRYHPEADLLTWIDADAWVQDMAPLSGMFGAAERGRLAIVSQTSRYAQNTMSVQWLSVALGLARVRSILYKNGRNAGLPLAVCRRLGAKPTLNAGCFTLARNAPHWDAMRRHMAVTLRRGRVFTVDQLAIGLAAYMDGLPVELCPETCNYMGPWRASDDGRTLVEFYTPYNPVGIVHMAGLDAMRADPSVTMEIPMVSGGSLARSLRRGAWI
ncbi:glycosyl transferase [Roseomonas sp. GC11]|uniref:glycosyl transferase n=1 Tax=Roseomonas sp. GC11 TaxID=2950546 RepID=UPI00210CC344|nr:glycosyl transferase [Roseomonas sp. GC11]MCQ4162110.1 glycosyl transferase [Roseomonas sp. GC11]